MTVIGVLALQGAFIEHVHAGTARVETREVRLPSDLEGLDGLIIPGGESTTIGKLLVQYDLDDRSDGALGLPDLGHLRRDDPAGEGYRGLGSRCLG